jgi:hypothetical protein
VADLASEALKLALRDLDSDLSSHHLMRYAGQVDGYLVTAKNSGTHGLRFMLSHAIAHHLDLPPPQTSSGPGSNGFIGHPKNGWAYPHIPKIGSSHNIPSRVMSLLGAADLMALPPTVVLVRDIREALASYYVKWAERYDLGSFSDYLRRPAPGLKKVDDVWWFIRFFNRWGEALAARPAEIAVVRQEDMKRDPAMIIRQVWAHWGVMLTNGDVAAGVEVSGRDAVAVTLDASYGETIVPERAKREAVVLSDEDQAYLAELFARHLKHDFGYGLIGAGDRHPARQA